MKIRVVMRAVVRVGWAEPLRLPDNNNAVKCNGTGLLDVYMLSVWTARAPPVELGKRA